ncbi:MAG: dGTPase [Terriglobales bacterium]
MAGDRRTEKPYDDLISGVRHRISTVPDRTLEEEADADRGRVLFCAPFRRLQNKAQVFSLESNAAVRSRLTHSLEVSSIGRFVAQQAIKAFSREELDGLGITGKERPLLTFVETACLLHDLGNPPFGHFGEIAISNWFHTKRDSLEPSGIGGKTQQTWNEYYADFVHFDGNPQGFRIATKLQPSQADLCGLNLTATTLAATLKYPRGADLVGQPITPEGERRKKAGYFRTEQSVVNWICSSLKMHVGARHPLVYLMEAADDIAYCVSDIEDGIEKDLITGVQFGEQMMDTLAGWTRPPGDKDAEDILRALDVLKKAPRGEKVTAMKAMNDFRSAAIRLLTRHAGIVFRSRQDSILKGESFGLLRDCEASPLIKALNTFASSFLYSSTIVRNREITAQAVLSGLLDAYSSLMACERTRFEGALRGEREDSDGSPIARDSSLISRVSPKYLSVYEEEVRQMEKKLRKDPGSVRVMERIHRMRLVVDYISGMTDEFAFQSFQLISGVQINPHRN